MEALMPAVVRNARTQLADLTGLTLASTVSVAKAEDGWSVRLEVVEKRSIPDSQDILAAYDVALDLEGNVRDFLRVGMRRRTDVALALADAEI